MEVWEAVAHRIRQLCRENGVTPNRMSKISGVPQATIKSILLGESKNSGTVAVKKLCDGFGITLGEFFSTEEFDGLKCPLPSLDNRCKIKKKEGAHTWDASKNGRN